MTRDYDRSLRREEAESHPAFRAAYERAADADEDGMHPPHVEALLHELREEYGDDRAIPAAVREHLIADWGAVLECATCDGHGGVCSCNGAGGLCYCPPCSACDGSGVARAA